MKTKILGEQILMQTGLGDKKATEICKNFIEGNFDAMADPLSAIILKSFDDHISEPDHDFLIMDIEHAIHQLQNTVKYIKQFTKDDELLIGDENYKANTAPFFEI